MDRAYAPATATNRVLLGRALGVVALISFFGTFASAQSTPDGTNITVNLGVLNRLGLPPVPGTVNEAPVLAPHSRLDPDIARRLGLLPDQRPRPPLVAAGRTDTTTQTTDEAPRPEDDRATVSAPVADPRPPAVEDMREPQAVVTPAPIEPASRGQEEELRLRIAFASASAVLAEDQKEGLKEIGTALQADPGLRLKLLAYAAKENETELFARRLSLSRSLAVRNYLIAFGVEQTRITVQALGARGEDVPDMGSDRVDVYFVRRQEGR